MPYVDVHCHINHEKLKDKLDEVLARAKEKDVAEIILSGVNPAGNKEVLALSEKYPMIKASLGMYPIDILGLGSDEVGLPEHKGKIDLDKEFEFIKENLDKVISIGEIGMDFHWASKEDTLEKQKANFRKIIRFAKEIKKPIVIHSRKAELECIEVLKEEIQNNEIFIVQHCFSGKKRLIKEAAELGHYFSVPANVVKSQNFQMLVELVDIKQLLTETDAPWLSPDKEKLNEPMFVVNAVKKIAEIKGITEKEAKNQIWNNYIKVFGGDV
jgi:TatD DNase family protein